MPGEGRHVCGAALEPVSGSIALCSLGCGRIGSSKVGSGGRVCEDSLFSSIILGLCGKLSVRERGEEPPASGRVGTQ